MGDITLMLSLIVLLVFFIGVGGVTFGLYRLSQKKKSAEIKPPIPPVPFKSSSNKSIHIDNFKILFCIVSGIILLLSATNLWVQLDTTRYLEILAFDFEDIEMIFISLIGINVIGGLLIISGIGLAAFSILLSIIKLK